MAYATVTDMIGRFGETEMIRLSSSDGPLSATVQAAPVDQALGDATAIIDGYLRKRYTTPLTSPTLDIVRAACVLARYDLASGGDREPATQVKEDRRDVISWLNKIAEGFVTLEGVAPISAGSSARSSDRTRMFGSPELGGW